ncbi:MAG: amidase [Thermomicrobiales bacterium]|nr:amidase [Thermomicrobiales bacterium]
MTDEIGFMSATEMRDRFRTRALSPVEVATAMLERIDALNPTLNAYATVTGELALAQAKAAEAAYAAGDAPSMAGIPISIKDLTMTKGIRTTRGSLLYKDWVPDEDAPFMDKVYASGAVVLGKTNSPEFGWKGETTNRVTGSSHNPWKHGRTPGGSSGGGAAAVAAGLGPIGQGSDGAGSIRIPCGFCGLYGLKPTWAHIAQYPSSGVIELAHLGPMTRTVADAALMLTATAGPDARDRNSWGSGTDYLAALDDLDISGLRVAWSPDLGYAPVEPEVRAATEAAAKRFAELGCEVEEAHPTLSDPWEIVHTIWASGMAAAMRDRVEREGDLLDPGLRAVVETGLEISAADLATAYLQRSLYFQAWRRFMDGYDLVLTPTLPCTAFPVGQDHPGIVDGHTTTYLGWTTFTYPFNVTGQPAATVPCGFDSQGLPIGLQIGGRYRDDATVLRASAAFERIAPWAQHRPSISR